ncbi:MAG: methyltransferase [Cyclobacteriaceae bacterium]|mgnify:CR=1 FL=1|nr:methyltransferase [Cyclobacteriaceae bacterium]MDX5467884.1 methyltransferase [Cyclobacteriaceae bacterium]
MGNSWFQFQQFKIHQDRCAMKISTDAVLLGSLADCWNARTILDVGTGTGVVALMLAQRAPHARIMAVEIDADASKQAMENFRESPFSERLDLFFGRFQDFLHPNQFELLVSNPPYFENHLKSKDPKRNKALHTDELSFRDLAEHTQRWLSPSGQIWIILPPRQMEELRRFFLSVGLRERKRIRIRDREASQVFREVCGFRFEEGEIDLKDLVLKDENGGFSPGYQRLLSGFLLGY